jgi:hypothetical protein
MTVASRGAMMGGRKLRDRNALDEHAAVDGFLVDTDEDPGVLEQDDALARLLGPGCG